MRAQHRRAATASVLLRLVFASLVVLGCLVIPVGVVYAQTPDATGTVTCKEVYYGGGWGVPPTTVVYPVEMSYQYPGFAVTGRWGADKNVTYVRDYFAGTESAFSIYFYDAMDESYESYYFETGKLDFKVAKNGTTTIKGKTFADVDFFYEALASRVSVGAECTWNLVGTMPPM